MTLRGDVHVGGVSAQQPSRQQREGYTSSAAVDLREAQKDVRSNTKDYTYSSFKTLSNGARGHSAR